MEDDWHALHLLFHHSHQTHKSLQPPSRSHIQKAKTCFALSLSVPTCRTLWHTPLKVTDACRSLEHTWNSPLGCHVLSLLSLLLYFQLLAHKRNVFTKLLRSKQRIQQLRLFGWSHQSWEIWVSIQDTMNPILNYDKNLHLFCCWLRNTMLVETRPSINSKGWSRKALHISTYIFRSLPHPSTSSAILCRSGSDRNSHSGGNHSASLIELEQLFDGSEILSQWLKKLDRISNRGHHEIVAPVSIDRVKKLNGWCRNILMG